MKLFDNFISRLSRRAVLSHIRKINDYFRGLDYDSQLAYFVMLMAKCEERRVEEGNADIEPLKKIIREGIEKSINEGHTPDGLISYYLCTINELLNIKSESAKKIQSKLTEENRKFFP